LSRRIILKGKRLLTLVVSVCLILVLLTAILLSACAKEEAPAAPAAPAAPEVLNWRFQNVLPAGNPLYPRMQMTFCDEIEKMSGGRVVITSYPAGALAPTTEIIEALAESVFELAFCNGAYIAGTIPEGNIEAVLPYGFERPRDMLNFFYDLGFIEILREAYAENGVYYVGLETDCGANFIMKEPLTKADDFKGRKIRSFGPIAKLAAVAGAATVFLPGQEVYTALSTGAIDGCTWGKESDDLAAGFFEICKYWIEPAPFECSTDNFLAGMDTWATLSPDLQAIIENVAKDHAIEYNRWQHYLTLDARKVMIEEYGVTINVMPDEEVRKMRVYALQVWDELAAANDRCAEAVEIYKDYARLLGMID